MTHSPDPVLVRRWSEDVARDPRSISFLPLARFYHGSGRHDAARRLCLRGLEQHPDNVEAHYLLGLIYRAAGEPERALDEWDIALRLDPTYTAARRELGLLLLERGDRDAARGHLERVAAAAPGDPAVERALARLQNGGGGIGELIRRLQPPVERFTRAAGAEVVLLINHHGKLLGQHGITGSLDPVAMASLAAGIHASARALARLLHQDGFQHLYQHGARGQLFLGSVATPADEVIVVAVMRDASRLGLLRVAFGAFAREVAALPVWAEARPPASAESFERELEAGWLHLFGGVSAER